MEMRAALRTMDRSGDEGLQGIPLYQLTSASYHLFDNVSSIRTTPSDFAKFLTLMMDDKRRKRWEISNATREDMLTPQYERTFSSENLPQGIGWGIERRAEGNYFYHGGNNNNTYVSLALGANDGSHGMVIMTNGPEGWSVIEDVTKLLAGVEFDCVY
jgi:CubicO group peptidase (beta-lactamase class C family)